MAETVLKIDPENPVALVITATQLSDQLPDSGSDQHSGEFLESKPDPSIAEIKKNSSLALETIDTSLFRPPEPRRNRRPGLRKC